MNGSARVGLAGVAAAMTIMVGTALGAETIAADHVQHVKVFSRKGRFAGWPANHGIWAWGDAYRSDDDGATWQQMANPVDDCGAGNAPSRTALHCRKWPRWEASYTQCRC